MAEAGDLEAERDKGNAGQQMCLLCRNMEGWSHKLRCGEPKKIAGTKCLKNYSQVQIGKLE
jgi:hypothetical protein